MSTVSEREWQQWTGTWQADAEPMTAPEAIRQHVRRRSRLLAVGLAGELVVALGFSVSLVYRATTHPDPLERLAMGLLALVAMSGLLASWWTWRGTLRASSETTAAFVALSIERSRRLRRAIAVGWGILLGELAVFVPWIWHRLYGGPQPPSSEAEWFSWGLLAGLTLLAVLYLASLHWWARADRRRLEALRQELDMS
jgi:hypothetical protein